jgi:predicted RNA-binding protein Jag
MAFTKDQYDQLLSKYCKSLVDNMDMDSLIEFAMDQIEINIRNNCSMDEELIEELGRYYDESDVAAMLEDVGANPADFGVSNWLDEDT